MISDRSVGVTPEYARQMAALGYGSPNGHELMNMKAVGVTPEYVAELKAAGIAPRDVHELVNLRAVGVTPEYAKELSAIGITGLSTQEIANLKAIGLTPERARWLKQTFPKINEHDMQQATVFNIDADFMAKAKAHGFNDSDFDKLIRLRMSGLLD